MRKLLFWFLFVPCALCFVPPCYAQEKIVAIVNKEIVTQKDYNDFISFMRMQLSQEYKGAELDKKMESMKKELLDKLIEDRIILQEAEKLKIIISPERIRERVDGLRRRYPSDAHFQQSLRAQGLVQADLEARAREQMLMYAVIEEKVRKNILITPSEVTEYYNQHAEEFIAPETGDFDSLTAIDRDTAVSAARDLKRGRDINEVINEFSLSYNKVDLARGQLKKEVEDVIFSLKPGEVSEPIEIAEKYYVFRLNKFNPPQKRTLAESQEDIRNYLFGKKMQESMEKWIADLKKRSFIKIL